MQNYFNELVNSYKKLSLDSKEEVLINELKEMILVYMQIADAYQIDYEILKSKEIVDINVDNYNKNDYLEAFYVYLNVLKNLTATIINDLLEKSSQ